MRPLLFLVVIYSFLSGCATIDQAPKPTPRHTASPVPTRSPAPTPTALATYTPLPTFTPIPTYTPIRSDTDSGWRLLRSGLEKREIDIVVDKRRLDHLSLLRIDPAFFRFVIAYDAEHPQYIDAWLKRTGALAVFNGGFFKVEKQLYLPAGLLVVNGQTSGKSYTGFGGMFTITGEGPQLRSLVEQPYRPGEQFQYALQSFPLLVKPGGQLGFPAQEEDYRPARRTVLGQDRAGRFIVIVTKSSYFTLHRLSVYLVDSDLDLDLALNLDGGPSSGLILAQPRLIVPATSMLPIVIAVYPH